MKPLNAHEAPEIHTFVVDGMKIVNMISVLNLKPSTFLTWTQNFLNYIINLKAMEIHIVFDIYSEIDLTRPSKSRSSDGEKKYISSLTQMLPPGKKEWDSFLLNSANKCRLRW